MVPFRPLIVTLFALSAALPAAAGPLRCAEEDGGGACVWGRADGIEAGSVNVRGLHLTLVGIVAPDKSDLCMGKSEFACARPARKRMAELVAKGVACDVLDVSAGQLFARCRVAEGDLGRLMVQSGLALAGRDGPYQVDQTNAIRERKGLWADGLTLPREWENARRKQDRDTAKD